MNRISFTDLVAGMLRAGDHEAITEFMLACENKEDFALVARSIARAIEQLRREEPGKWRKTDRRPRGFTKEEWYILKYGTTPQELAVSIALAKGWI
jgi:hypothetical protein